MTFYKFLLLLYLLVLMTLTNALNYASQPYNSDSEGILILPKSNGDTLNKARLNRENDNSEEDRGRNHQGIFGPIHTFVKTDRNAHFKWGVRHYVDQGNAGHH